MILKKNEYLMRNYFLTKLSKNSQFLPTICFKNLKISQLIEKLYSTIEILYSYITNYSLSDLIQILHYYQNHKYNQK